MFKKNKMQKPIVVAYEFLQLEKHCIVINHLKNKKYIKGVQNERTKGKM